MKRTTKDQLINDIFKLCDESQSLFDNGLKELMDSEKITSGSYWYLLNLHREISYAKFFGMEFAGKACVAMCTHKNNYKVRDFERIKKSIENFIKTQQLTIKLGVHDLDKCRDIVRVK